MRECHDYPINYAKSLAQAHQQVELPNAIEVVQEIEDRWVRISKHEEYSLADLKRDALLCDIRALLRCSIIFINRIIEQEALLKHHKPDPKMMRQVREIALPLE